MRIHPLLQSGLALLLLCTAAAHAEEDVIELDMDDGGPAQESLFMTIDRLEQPKGWERLEGELHQIVGKGAHIWGVNHRGGTYKWKGRGWEGDALSPPLYQVSVGFDGHRWGLTPDGRVWRHNGRKWEEMPEAPQLEYLDARNHMSAVGIVMDEDIAYHFDGIRWYSLRATGKAITVGPGGQWWLLTNEGAAMRYEGRWPAGHFALVPQPAESAIYSIQYCDDDRITITTADERLLYWNGDGWTEFPGRGRFFVRSNTHTMSVGSDGSVWRYQEDGGKNPRRAKRVDTETEAGENEYEADKAEEQMIV